MAHEKKEKRTAEDRARTPSLLASNPFLLFSLALFVLCPVNHLPCKSFRFSNVSEAGSERKMPFLCYIEISPISWGITSHEVAINSRFLSVTHQLVFEVKQIHQNCGLYIDKKKPARAPA